MKKHLKKIIPALAVLSLAAGCGKDSGSGSGSGDSATLPQFQEDAAVDGSNIQGHYQAKFITLNPQVNGTIPGSANFFRQDDRLYAYIRLFAGGVKAWHMQFVYDGNRCPTQADDTNGDGFVDIQEAEAVTGKILIPMDSDISSQNSGRRFFPLGDLSGYYYYEQITSFKRFFSDLSAADNDPTDEMVKLAPGEGLRLEGKVFMVLGVAESVVLPDTVATKERRRSFQTLPVACGVYQKVETIPGTTFVEGEIPGPVAAVDPDQDRPATDTIPDTTTGGQGGAGSGTNSSEDGDGPMSDGGSTRTTGGSTTGGTTAGDSTTGSTNTGHSSGTTTGGGASSESSTGGSTTGGGEAGSSSTGTVDSSTTTGGSTSTSTSSTTTTSSSSSSTSSSSTGTTTGGFLDSSSGV